VFGAAGLGDFDSAAVLARVEDRLQESGVDRPGLRLELQQVVELGALPRSRELGLGIEARCHHRKARLEGAPVDRVEEETGELHARQVHAKRRRTRACHHAAPALLQLSYPGSFQPALWTEAEDPRTFVGRYA